MARRKDHSRDELKEMVISVGYQLIEKGGISELSTRKIANAIGYTVGTLYNIFSNFDEIKIYINSKILENLYVYLQSNMKYNSSSILTIKQLAKLYIRFAEDNKNLWEALTSNSYVPRGGMPPYYIEKTDKLFKLVENALLGECSDSLKVERSARILWASVHGICMLGLNGRLKTLNMEDVNSLTDGLIENYIKGLNI